MVYKKTGCPWQYLDLRGREGGSWKKLYIEQPNYLYSSPNIIIIKWRRVRWMGYGAHILGSEIFTKFCVGRDIIEDLSQTNSPPPRTIHHCACFSHMAKITACVTSDPFTWISHTCTRTLVPICAVSSLVISCVSVSRVCKSFWFYFWLWTQALYWPLSTLVPCCYIHCLVVLILRLALQISFHNFSLPGTLSL